MNSALQTASASESFDLARQFIEHMVTNDALARSMNGYPCTSAVDWKAVQATIADSRTLEHAIGRAVVIASQMCRGACHESPQGAEENRPSGVRPSVAPRSRTTTDDLLIAFHDDDPFFSFNSVDAIPDFGDESRYRTRVARKMARVCGIRRAVATQAVAS